MPRPTITLRHQGVSNWTVRRAGEIADQCCRSSIWRPCSRLGKSRERSRMTAMQCCGCGSCQRDEHSARRTGLSIFLSVSCLAQVGKPADAWCRSSAGARHSPVGLVRDQLDTEVGMRRRSCDRQLRRRSRFPRFDSQIASIHDNFTDRKGDPARTAPLGTRCCRT